MQTSPPDDVIVVGDGEQAEWVKALVTGLGYRYLVHGETRDFGNSQREFACNLVHGDYVVFQDDDDVFLPDAFVKIRKAIAQEPGVPGFLFKVIAPWGETVWSDEGIIEQGNVCTIQMVLKTPRDRAWPRWPRRQGGNIPYLKAFIETHGPVSWRDEIISECRPRRLWWERT